MFGSIKYSQFDEEKNESLLHFECTHIESAMRNAVLGFVYNMLPEPEKEVLEALSLTEEDLASDITAPKDVNNPEEQAENTVAEENSSAALTSL